jgi:hypothetical protein
VGKAEAADGIVAVAMLSSGFVYFR